MTSMIERVSEAACSGLFDSSSPTAAGKAAIKAMREPTPGMIVAGVRSNGELPVRRIWQAMIDAALEEDT